MAQPRRGVASGRGGIRITRRLEASSIAADEHPDALGGKPKGLIVTRQASSYGRSGRGTVPRPSAEAIGILAQSLVALLDGLRRGIPFQRLASERERARVRGGSRRVRTRTGARRQPGKQSCDGTLGSKA